MKSKYDYIKETQKALSKLYNKSILMIDYYNSSLEKNMLPDRKDIEQIVFDYYPYGSINDNAESCNELLKSSTFFDIKGVEKLYSGYEPFHNYISKNEIEGILSGLNTLKEKTIEVYILFENAKERLTFINENMINLWNLASILNIIIQYFEYCINSNTKASKSELRGKINESELRDIVFKCNTTFKSLHSFEINIKNNLNFEEFSRLNNLEIDNIQNTLETINRIKVIAKIVYDSLNAAKEINKI